MLFDHKLAWKDPEIYKLIYENSIQNPNGFWLHQAKDLDWFQTPDIAYDEISEEWFQDGKSNICHNCVDRHVEKNGNKPALIWYGDNPGTRREITYKELFIMVSNISLILKEYGAKKGDTIGIYMPMIPEAVAAMLACCRIGAIHMVVFTGFSVQALKDRLADSGAKIVISCFEGHRGGRVIKIRENIEEAIKLTPHPVKAIYIEETDLTSEKTLECETLDNTDISFLMYTSGSTGKPKPIKHTVIGYMVYAYTTFKYIFDIKDDDIYFCTSDIGWITGHTYITYAPLMHGSTVVIFEGSPTYPTADRYWEITEKEKVTVFYTAPTALRSLSMFSNEFVDNHDLSSLRILGSVGEPINKDAWDWYFNKVGKGKLPIMDTWWQTETGGIMIAPLLDTTNLKPCFASKPFFGVVPKIIEGALVIEKKWPCVCLNREIPFISGDGAILDSDFDIKVTGRIDDVINISGHRLSASEIENVVNSIDGIIESAVVAVPHEIKGQSAFVYAAVFEGCDKEKMQNKIISSVKNAIGSISRPDYVAFIKELPKTRSGKIMRSNLKKIAINRNLSNIDSTTAVNDTVFDDILKSVENVFECPDVCSVQKRVKS